MHISLASRPAYTRSNTRGIQSFCGHQWRSTMLQNSIRWLFPLKVPSRNRRRPALFRPTLEALEGRAVPSVYHVTTNADSGPGSLRDAVVAANAHAGADQIVFDGGLAGHTITLTSGELLVTDD